MIGVANIFLESLFHDVKLQYAVPIISQQGEVRGHHRLLQGERVLAMVQPSLITIKLESMRESDKAAQNIWGQFYRSGVVMCPAWTGCRQAPRGADARQRSGARASVGR